MKYSEKDLVRVAKRENNVKRNYLVVDPLQGKHIPVSPAKALELFTSLADKIRGKYQDERLLLIGFAETATAIGAQVAVSLGTMYIQTTREIISDVGYLFFSEEHSHAAEQKLVKDDIDEALKHTDRIVFVEDEVTTGKTILNIISVMRKEYRNDIKFAVLSILNGMSEEHRKIYEEKAIDLHYLVKTDHSKYGDIADSFAGDGEYIDCSCKTAGESVVLSVPGRMNARRLVEAREYEAACQRLFEEIIAGFSPRAEDKILVVGTEEFMYPALFVAARMEKLGYQVKFHATTRSPIIVSQEEQYPLHARYELCSLYDSDRKTFLYDIGTYGKVLVVTDADILDDKGMNSLLYALRVKNKDITVVRWC